MKSIQQLITEKKEQITKLQAQLELLQELQAEASGSSGRGARARTTVRARRGGRRRGANMEAVLGALTTTPIKAADLAKKTGLSSQAVNQVLMALRKKRQVQRTGRGMYALAGAKPAKVATAPKAAKKSRTRKKAATKARPKTKAKKTTAEAAKAEGAAQA